MRSIFSCLGSAFMILFLASTGRAGDPIPVCLSYHRPLPDNSQQLLHWKRTTRNTFQERGHAFGVITRLYTYTKTHAHFEIQIGPRADDTLEVIYNQEFGPLPPNISVGQHVEACGDFITSTDYSGPHRVYPPSPDGAIIHWIHFSPDVRRHESGFLAIDGVLYGQDLGNAGPRHFFPRNPSYANPSFRPGSPAFYGR